MGLMTTTVHSRFPFFPLSFLDSPFFSVSFFSTLFESHANAGTLEWDRELSFPPLSDGSSLLLGALLPLCPADWELSIICERTGSLLKKVHVGQRRSRECGCRAEWREGRQLAGTLLGLFYLSSLSLVAFVGAV